MNARQMKLVDILYASNSWIKGHELSSMLNVTARTIRSDIEVLNGHLDCSISSHTRNGYKLTNRSLLKETLNKNNTPQSPEDRSLFIIRKLLLTKGSLNLLSIQEELFVSEHTIENDLRRIRTIISKYPNIRLIRSKNYLSFKSDEQTLRKLYSDLVNNEVSDNVVNLNRSAKYFKQFNLIELAHLLESILLEENYSLRDRALPIALIHVGILVERLLIGKQIDSYATQQVMHDECSQENIIAKRVLIEIKSLLNINYNEFEINEVAKILYAYRASKTRETQDLNHEFNHDIETCVTSIVGYLKDSFQVDFANDEVFVSGMELHIQSLLERAINEINIKNPFLDDLKQTYPLVFEMSVHVSHLIGTMFNATINETEIGFIALHIGSAYGRIQTRQRYRVALISPYEPQNTGSIKEKILDKFNDRLELVSIAPYYEESMIRQLQPDLLITFMDLDHALNIPSSKISVFMSDDDFERINQLLNKLDRDFEKNRNLALIEKLIDQDTIFKNVSASCSHDVKAFICEDLYESSHEYLNSMVMREDLSATSFQTGIACPKTLDFNADKTRLSIYRLDKPLLWHGQMIELIMHLSVSKEDSETFKQFKQCFTPIFHSVSKVERLLTCDSIQSFKQNLTDLCS